MTSETDDRYSEEEIGLILRRAADTQPGRSLTLAEIEAVATEAGLDVAQVRRAATELRVRPTVASGPSTGLFGPTMLTQERRVEGRIDASAWGELVAQIRCHLKIESSVEHLGKELVWSSDRRGSGRDVRVQVTPRRGHTVIRVHERTGHLALRLYLGLVGGLLLPGTFMITLVCMEMLQTTVLIPVLLVVWVYGWYRLAQTIYRAKLAIREYELDALATSLADTSADIAEHRGAAALTPGKPDDE